MVNATHLLSALLFVSLSFFSLVAKATEFTAQVDRTTINEQDRFVLLLRYHDQSISGSPDLSPLEQDFEILGRNRSSQFRSINGRNESYTEWQLTLSAKGVGDKTIPAIQFRGENTQPIAITVKPLSEDIKKQRDKEFFFHVEVSTGPYVVQGQIVYIEKLFYRLNHDRPSLSDFVVADARIEALGEIKQYTTQIDGQTHGVYERRYAIFPEQSGELVIPGQRFQATVRNRFDRYGRDVSLVSRPIRMQVDAIPADYPSAPWLPAKQVTLLESYSSQQWQVGEPITRSITLTADGLSEAQLPPLSLTPAEHLRYYPDQAKTQQTVSDQGIRAQRVEAMAIVASQAGEVTLPELQVQWWNTQTQQVEIATLPARTIYVAPAAEVTASAPDNSTDHALANIESNGAPSVLTAPLTSGWWIISTILLFVSNGVLLFLLWRKHQQTDSPSVQPTEQLQAVSRRQAWKALQQAAKNNQPQAIRQALLGWAQATFGKPCNSLSDMTAHISDPALNAALAELDATLFSKMTNSAYNGQNLLSLLKNWNKQGTSNAKNSNSALPSLYPTN